MRREGKRRGEERWRRGEIEGKDGGKGWRKEMEEERRDGRGGGKRWRRRGEMEGMEERDGGGGRDGRDEGKGWREEKRMVRDSVPHQISILILHTTWYCILLHTTAYYCTLYANQASQPRGL